jgi:hypothetical protein
MSDEEGRINPAALETPHNTHENHTEQKQQDNITLADIRKIAKAINKFIGFAGSILGIAASAGLLIYLHKENPEQIAAYKDIDLETKQIELENSQLLKREDIEAHCNDRWQHLSSLRIDINKSTNDKRNIRPIVEEYYRQFWALQTDQFIYFAQGYLPKEVYIGWLCVRRREFKRNACVGGVSYIDGYELFGKNIVYLTEDFKNIVDFLSENKLRNDLTKCQALDATTTDENQICDKYEHEEIDSKLNKIERSSYYSSPEILIKKLGVLREKLKSEQHRH